MAWDLKVALPEGRVLFRSSVGERVFRTVHPQLVLSLHIDI